MKSSRFFFSHASLASGELTVTEIKRVLAFTTVRNGLCDQVVSHQSILTFAIDPPPQRLQNESRVTHVSEHPSILESIFPREMNVSSGDGIRKDHWFRIRSWLV